MINFLIHKPIAVIMVFIALCLLGIIASSRIPVSPLPDISIPEISVHINENNISARELESTVVQTLRVQLQQVSSLDNIHSETHDGYAVIRMKFKYGTNIDYAFIEVNEKIDLSMNGFPREMERPRVVRATAVDMPVFYINMRLKDSVKSTGNQSKFMELSDFASQVVKRRLEQQPEIAFADITGVSHSELYIIPDQATAASLNLKDQDFKQIIESNNLIYGNVSANDGVLQYNIRFAAASPASVDEVRSLTFKVHGRIFKLGDIATVGVRQQEARGLFLSHNQDAVNLAVIKQPDTRLDNLRQTVNNLIADLQNNYPDIIFEQTQDQTALLEFSINNLKQDLLIGSLIAFVLMFFFLGNLRAPLLIGITIPVCLLLSLLAFSVLHITINIISLSGLVLGVGLMIDNSIIVIDNITRYHELGTTLSEACVKGTTEIIRPLIASGFTTCSVFLPLIFLSGISGALFYDQAMAITIGLVVSLIVSVTLLPVMYRLFHQRAMSSFEHGFFEKIGIMFFERMYETGFRWTFRNKKASLLIVVMLISSNWFLFGYLKKEKLPAFEENELVIRIDWNNNITLAENRDRVSKLVMMIEKYISQSNAMIGEQQYLLSREKELSTSEAQIFIKAKLSRDLNAVKTIINNCFRTVYPQASLSVRAPKNIFEQVFGDNEPDVVIELRRADNELLPSKQYVDGVKVLVEKQFPGTQVSPVPIQHNLSLEASPEKLLYYDVSIDDLYRTIKNALNVTGIGSLHSGIQQLPIVIAYQKNYLDKILSNLRVINSSGTAVPVLALVTINREGVYKVIEGDRNGNFIPLAINSPKPLQLMETLNKELKNRNKLGVSFSGGFFSNQALIKEMLIVLMVAIALLYFILAAQFESLIQPFIVLFELPISMSGALIMLFVFHSSINLISLIGLVVMCGIIINDSILKIDTINQLRRNEGYQLMDAIHTAGLRRLKSIIMTAMTTVLSVAPFMFGSDIGSTLQRPLSLALIGGMVLGTPVSLYFIPLVYWFYYTKGRKKEMILVSH